MQLIFIEGVSGVGKSTATTKLCDYLRGRGYSADSYIEADINNPIDLYWYAYLTTTEYKNILTIHHDFVNEIVENSICNNDYVLVRYQDFNIDNNSIKHLYSSELYDYFKEREVCYKTKTPVSFEVFTQIFVNRWEIFLSSESAVRDYILFDGAFLAHQINDIIRNYKSSDDKTIEHLKIIWDIVKEYNPIVFYMESQDIWERIQSAQISRRQSIPPKEQTVFWENRKRIDLLALDRLPVESHRYDISDGCWDSAIAMMESRILETPEEHRARIYPVILSENNPA